VLTGRLQASAFNEFRQVALPLAAVSLLYLAVTAWREGQALRERASGAALSQRDLGHTHARSEPTICSVPALKHRARRSHSLLVICLLVDLAGDSSFVINENSDLLWAPASGLLLNALFDSPALGALNLVKELLPGTDIVPVATLAWLVAYAYPESAAAKVFGVRRLSEDVDERDSPF
jgi:hypothetical protein